MASGIKASPNTYDFGEDFNYTRWNENTVLTLVNVPWNSDYRDVWRASSKAAFDSWIDGRNGLSIPNVSLAKFNRNVRVNTPINAAMRFNYLRASNPLMPITGDVQRSYYYFIQDVQYISPNTTELVLQLDAWQTFGYDVTFGNCYIERGHIGIANTHAFDNYGRDYLNVAEGLDTGGEYRIVKTAQETVMDMSDDADEYSVLICSVVDLTKDPGTAAAPKLTTAPGGNVDNIPTGASFYVFPTGDDFRKFMKEYQTLPWITQGIISITIIPAILRYFPGASLTNVATDVHNAIPLPSGGGVIINNPPDYAMYAYPAGKSGRNVTALAPAWRDSFLNFLPAQYRILKKLLTYPYSLIELTTWTGQPLIVRPEAWNDPDATLWEQAIMLPPSQRIAFLPYRYNADSSTSSASHDDNGEYLDMATTIDNFPAVPIVNNMAINYLAANKNGLAFEFRSADWSQQRALRGAQATSDVAGSDIRNTARQTSAGITATGAQAALSATTSINNAFLGMVPGSAVAGGNLAGAGSTGGAAAGAAGAAALQDATAAMQAGNTSQAMLQGGDISNQQRSAAAISSIQASGEIRDTNVSLARFAAKGDYQNQIAGVNAKIQDSRLTQPSTSGQFGGDAMNLAHGNAEVSARWKFIDNSTLKSIGNFWLRYGYAIHQFITMPSSFMCMTKFTYWKLNETYIVSGAIPEQFKQAIRGIFEKGVTVWAQPEYIGTTALSDNAPLGGISY